MKHAVIENGIVVNLADATEAFGAQMGWIPAPEGAAIGATWDGSAFGPAPAEPPRPVPDAISRFQARAALLNAGLLGQVEAAIAQADAMTQLAWAEAVEWKRSSPLINAIGAQLGLTPAQMDALFASAAQIEV